MSQLYKHVLIIGGTAGIGRAMGDRFLDEGMKVTIVGRRQERLDEFVAKYGREKAAGMHFDIEDLASIPNFAERAFTSHPDIDCVFLNAGTQSQANFAQPDTVDLARFHRDVTVNFSAHVALVHAVLPYLLGRKEQTSLIFTGTPISLIPVFISPAYSSSKAALDGFLMCLREQLRSTNVKVAHISPGPVETELHGTVVGNEAVAKFGMSINDFVEEAYRGLVDGKDDIFPGTVGGSTKEQFLELVKTRDEAVGRLNALMHKMMQKH